MDCYRIGVKARLGQGKARKARLATHGLCFDKARLDKARQGKARSSSHALPSVLLGTSANYETPRPEIWSGLEPHRLALIPVAKPGSFLQDNHAINLGVVFHTRWTVGIRLDSSLAPWRAVIGVLTQIALMPKSVVLCAPLCVWKEERRKKGERRNENEKGERKRKKLH